MRFGFRCDVGRLVGRGSSGLRGGGGWLGDDLTDLFAASVTPAVMLEAGYGLGFRWRFLKYLWLACGCWACWQLCHC